MASRMARKCWDAWGHLRSERRSAGEAGVNVFLNTLMIWEFFGMLLYWYTLSESCYSLLQLHFG
jgi:hypothetical protein